MENKLPQRIGSRLSVRQETGCWIWPGANNRGYGTVNYEGKQVQLHRLSYRLHRGEIPEGMQIDHLCRTPPCCNPAHLEAVTPAENARRAFSSRKHCKQGHQLAPDNVYVYVRGGHIFRACRICRKASVGRYRVARAEERRSRPPLVEKKPPRLCTMTGCEQRHQAKGLCSGHLYRLKRYGDPSVSTYGTNSTRSRGKGA
jgi:hypothetical protein